MESRNFQRPKATAYLEALRLFFAILFLIIGQSSYVQASPGSLDPSFGSGGKVTTAIGVTDDEVFALVIQPDGKTVAAGYSNTGTLLNPVDVFALARYNTDGSLDATFGTGGKVTTAIGTVRDKAFALIIQPDGKLIAAGYSYDTLLAQDVFALVRYNTDGSLDPTFGAGGKVTTVVGGYDLAFALAIQTDGKLVAGGYSYNNTSATYLFALARYSPTGTLDATFGTGGKVTTAIGSDDAIDSLIIQPDGKIVGAGYAYNDILAQYVFALARYSTTGALDGTFGTGGIVTTAVGGDDTINSLIIQPDGKLVTAGYAYDNTLSQYVFGLARYSTTGVLDGTFGTGGKVTTAIGYFDDVAYALIIQVDGKLVAAGYSYDDTINQVLFALARYNTNGTLDTTVNPLGLGAPPGVFTMAFGAYDDEASALAIQPDGKLVAAGYTANSTGTQYSFALARYLGGLTITIPPGSSLPACVADYNGTCAFAPNPLTIESGDSVVWSNTDGAVPHTATSDDHIDNLVLTQPVAPTNSFSTPLIAGGASSPSIGPFVTTVTQTKLYHCSLHPNMKGTLIILPHQNHPPSAVSVSPMNIVTGPGAVQIFTAVYSDPDGWQDIAAANFYLAGGLHNEWLHYLVAPNVFTMLGSNDFCSPGQAKTLSSGFLTLDCAASSVSGSGTVLTVTFSVTPQPSSLGMQYNIFSAASDQYGGANAIFAGTWGIQNHPPSAGSCTPMSSTTTPGTFQTFVCIYSDPDGWQNIAAANFYLAGGLHNEWLHYLVAPNVFTMLGSNDICSPGQATTISSGFLTLDCGSSSISGSGTVLTVTLRARPEPSSSGMQYNIFSAASDQYGGANAIFAGTWGIQ